VLLKSSSIVRIAAGRPAYHNHQQKSSGTKSDKMDTSYLEKQVSTIINKLHELFDEIGVPSHERDTRESDLFAALSETLHNQLRIVTT
jgi:hypothetical protein